jgi:hypothetical protein
MRESMPSLLEGAKHHALAWLKSIADRPVRATQSGDDLRETLGGPLPHEGIDAEILIGNLANAALRGTVASAGPRYFGFVVVQPVGYPARAGVVLMFNK